MGVGREMKPAGLKAAIIAGCVVLSVLNAPGAHAETPEEYCLREYGQDNKAYDRCMRERHAYAVESRNSPYAEKDYIWACASYPWKALRSGTPVDGCVRRYCDISNNPGLCDDGNWGPVPRKLRKMQRRDLGRVPRKRYVTGPAEEL